MGQVFINKSLKDGPVLQKVYFFKSAFFEREKPLEMGPDFRKFLKSSKICRYLKEKNP